MQPMKIIIAGDYCPINRVADVLEEQGYEDVLGTIKCIVSEADYSIVNLECPVVERNAIPIEKCGPNLKCSNRGVEALKWAGFDCVTLANNHFYDFGDIGVQDTLTALQKNKIDFVGGGMNLIEASEVLFKKINGKVLAIVNCCEREFSIATECSGGANPLNPIHQYNSIVQAKKRADYVIVIVHGGFEHYQLPSIRMQETYRFFIDAGADAVINHHQHCYSGYEIYNEKPIFYGLGNFCFDWKGKRNDKWNEGFLVLLDLNEKISFEVIPYNQCDSNPSIVLINEKDKFFESLEFLSSIISNQTELKSCVKKYLQETYRNYIFCFETFYNRYTKKYMDKGVIPSNIRKKRLALIDFIGNESHYEKIMETIKEAFK